MTKQVEPVEKMLAKMRVDYKNSATSGKLRILLIPIFYSSIIGSIVNGAFDSTAEYSLEIGIAFIIFGILCGFFGKKLVKPVSFLTGFLVGAGLSLSVTVLKLKSSSFSRALDPVKILVISGAGGTVFGVLMLAFYKFIIYSILGGFVSLISTMLVWEYANRPDILQYPVASAAFIIGTFLASLIPTFSTIVVTSGLGSYLLSVGIDCIIKSGFNHIFAFGFGYSWSDVGASTSDEVFGLLAFWIIMFLWMGIRQLFTKVPHEGKDGKYKVKNNNSANGKEFVDA